MGRKFLENEIEFFKSHPIFNFFPYVTGNSKKNTKQRVTRAIPRPHLILLLKAGEVPRMTAQLNKINATLRRVINPGAVHNFL